MTQLLERFSFSKEGVTETATGQVFSYFAEGLTAWNPEQWTKLKPLKVLPEGRRPTTPVLEIVSRKDGFHAWVRVIHPSGEVFSVGMLDELHGPKMGNIAQSRHAVFRCPDVYEFLEDEPNLATVPLDDSVYDKIIHRLEKYNELGAHFNWVDQNCNTFTAHIAHLAGKDDIDLRTNFGRMVTPPALRHATPEPIRAAISKAMDVIGALGMNQILNGLLALLGGTRGARPRGEDRGPEVGALLTSPLDFVTSSKLQIDWPKNLRSVQFDQAKQRVGEARAIAVPPTSGWSDID